MYQLASVPTEQKPGVKAGNNWPTVVFLMGLFLIQTSNPTVSRPSLVHRTYWPSAQLSENLLLELGWPVVFSENNKLKAMTKDTKLNLVQLLNCVSIMQ